MDAQLSSAVAKIARANEHLEGFLVEANAFIEDQAFHIEEEHNADATEHIARVIFDKQPDFTRWALIAGDCLHNLRSALDHLLYALAVARSGSDPPPDASAIQFPIAETEDEFAKVRWHSRMFPEDVRTTIEGLQPYNRIQPPYRHPMLLLHELNNIDKHRLLRLAAWQTLQAEVRFTGLPHPNPRVAYHGDAVDDGTALVTLYTDVPAPNVQMYIDVTLFIAVAHTPAPDGSRHSGADWVLEVIRDEVAYIVGEIEPLFPNV